MAKKFHWLKLKEDFFRNKKIKKLRRIAGGDTYTIIYLKMQLLSLINSGELFYEGVEDSFIDELALEIDEDTENVAVTVRYLMSNDLLVEISGSYTLPEVLSAIGTESSSAERVRKHRALKKSEEQKKLQCNTKVTNCNTEIEIEKELELEKEDIKHMSDSEKSDEPKIQNPIEIEFDEIWESYPNKKSGRKKAFSSYKTARKKVDKEKIIEGLQGLLRTTNNWQYLPHLTTWLNQERWEVDYNAADAQPSMIDKYKNVDW